MNNHMNITVAEQERVDQFKTETDQILKALGHPEALVTDLSDVFDFLTIEFPDISKEDLKEIRNYNNQKLMELSHLMKRKVSGTEKICELAEELSKQ